MFQKPTATQVTEPCGLAFSQLSKLPDDLVMAHVVGGHDDALAVIFERYHRMVFGVARKILRNRAEAEDVSQAVFLEIYRHTVHFDPSKGTIKGWLLQYAYHRSLNRKRYLKVRAFEQAAEFAAAEAREAEESFQNGAWRLNLIERAVTVRQALRSLSHAQRRTLQLAFFEGLALEEISKLTGESSGNVRHHYYRGLKKLKSVLQGEVTEPSLVVPERTANVDA